MLELEAWFLISLNSYTCLSYLSVTMLRYPDKYSLRKKELFGSQFKIHSIMLGKLRDQELEAASHVPHRVRKKKSMSIWTQLTFFSFCHSGLHPREQHHPWWADPLTSVNLIRITPTEILRGPSPRWLSSSSWQLGSIITASLMSWIRNCHWVRITLDGM